jgi:hypothetical protein
MTHTDARMSVSDKRAAEIAALSRQRLRYWEKTDLITPDVERKISPRNVVRLYSLPRVVELVVASELRKQGSPSSTSGGSSSTYGSRATSLPSGRCDSHCRATGWCSSTRTDPGRTRGAPSRA